MTEEEWNELKERVQSWDDWRQKRAAEAKRKNCMHPNKNGTGVIVADGSSKSTWTCRDCGASGSSEMPPRGTSDPVRVW